MTHGRPAAARRRGFIFGELLVALLLLTIAVSSLAALMYSVSRRSEAPPPTECASTVKAKPGKCNAPTKTSSESSKLLRSTLTRCQDAACKDGESKGSEGTVVRPRTDSAALEIVAKRERAKSNVRTDRGFIR